jgi:hypothetical protein
MHAGRSCSINKLYYADVYTIPLLYTFSFVEGVPAVYVLTLRCEYKYEYNLSNNMGKSLLCTEKTNEQR